MIKIKPDNNNGKIKEIEYENNGLSKLIEPKIYVVSNLNDPKNIGTILEKYRKLGSESEEYFNENKLILDTFISNITLAFENFEPDQIVCFLPTDKNRRYLLKEFSNKVKSTFQVENINDHTDKFSKKDGNKSIKDGLTGKDYELQIDSETDPFKNLLIIDDTIDKGDTLKIYLDKLIEKNLINDDTIIKVICIYCNAKMEKINYLEAF